MELKETIGLMASVDYKDRFKAEYWQLKIRCDKLKAILLKWEVFDNKRNRYYAMPSLMPTLEKTLGFEPSCSYRLLSEQLKCMEEYLHCLEVRAVIEDIDLSK